MPKTGGQGSDGGSYLVATFTSEASFLSAEYLDILKVSIAPRYHTDDPNDALIRWHEMTWIFRFNLTKYQRKDTIADRNLTNIHSERINLLDVMKLHAPDVAEIELQAGTYFARVISLEHRNLTFIGKQDKVFLDIRDCDIASFHLVNSSLTLVSFTIKPSLDAMFVFAEESILNLTNCNITTPLLSNPILYGENSQLILKDAKMSDLAFSSSVIEGSPYSLDPHLTLLVDDSYFDKIVINAQKPVLAGPDVKNVTVLNSRFRHITCEEEGPLPTEKVSGVDNRIVVIKATDIWNVEGALSGGLVYGVQARHFTLKDVHWYGGTNAVRFSNNVAFSEDIDINIHSSNFEYSTTSQLWPNGGFFCLLNDRVYIKISNTSICGSSAPEGHGGFIYFKNPSTIMINDSHVADTLAGKSGGFIFTANYFTDIILDNLTVRGSRALEDGGSLYLDDVSRFEAINCSFSESHAYNQGGAIFFNDSDNSKINFTYCSFWFCTAVSGLGEDVLLSYKYVSHYNVSKKNFIKCVSNNTRHKVTFLPKVVHAEWTNSDWMDIRSAIIAIAIGVCVLIAVFIFLICLCCRCGCCVACGRGRKKANAYQHMESQLTTSLVPAQMSSNQHPPPPAHPSHYPPQQGVYVQPVAQPGQFQQYPALPANQMGVGLCINN
ncbi:hypothetical protein BLNAU_12476 [Blattamonas nauphoetae]|uniref:Right handed beta helix domain-containing protein n=1 Tax=Blattamonas nauphoetae TaxID=2049346 RepID=A0ABQ9XJN4_9EUKA|nr:hypothetical protein BLNAU_12476 [Blattamonas nauphoetae]